MRLDPMTRTAISATLHCLTGCAVGEVLGLAIAAAIGLSMGASIALAFGLAMVFGYAFTLVPVLRTGVGVRAAIGIALAADTVSIVTMELVDNAIVLAIPGAMESGLSDPLFWGSLAVALGIAFVATVPVNRWLIARGKGHAVVHHLHHGAPQLPASGSDHHGAAAHHDMATHHDMTAHHVSDRS
jgi:hypothetical protein